MFIPAIVGVVPDQMVQALTAFMDFCYLARRSSHTDETLGAMERSLKRFHLYREVFREEGIRANFSLPRQHALVHYVMAIRRFGSPNGLCTSITESKHIEAVKKPWRASSKFHPLQQILCTNVRMAKLAAARAVFAARRMLQGGERDAARKLMGLADESGDDVDQEDDGLREVYEAGGRVLDVSDVEDEASAPSAKLAVKAGELCPVL